MRLRRISLWSGIGLLSLLLLAIGWLWYADLGVFKPHLERWASNASGREISIKGMLHIDLARHASFIAEDIHVSNPQWAADREMLHVGRVEVHLDLMSLLNGPLIVESLQLADTELLLLESDDGEPNWMFSPQPAAPRSDDGAGVLLEKVEIARTTIRYEDVHRAAPLVLGITDFSQQHRADDMLQMTFDGTLNDRPAEIAGELGSWEALLAQRDVRFDLRARLDNFAAELSGKIDDLASPRHPTLNFTATAPDINELLALLGVPEEGAGVIDLSGSLQPDAQQQLRLELQGQLGRTQILAQGSASDLQDLQQFELDVSATGTDVRPLLRAIGIQQAKESPFELRVDAERRGSSLLIRQADMQFGDAQLALTADIPNFPAADDARVRLQLGGPDIERFRQIFNLPGQATGAFSLGVTLERADSGIEILDLDLRTSLLELHADGSLGSGRNYIGTVLNIDLLSGSAQTLASAWGLSALPDGPLRIEGSVEFTAEGIRTRDVLRASLGEVSLGLDGRISNAPAARGSEFQLSVAGPDLAALLASFRGTSKVPALPYELAGQLRILDSGFDLRDFSGKLGSTRVRVDGRLVPAARIAGSHLDVAASGPAFEELLQGFDGLQVNPGNFELGARLEFAADRFAIRDAELHRPGGDAEFMLELGLPAARRSLRVELRADGPDVRSVLRGVPHFEAHSAPFGVELRTSRDDTEWIFDELDIGVGAAKLRASGKLDFADGAAASNFIVDLNLPSTAALGEIDGLPVREQAFALHAQVQGQGGLIEVDDLHATLGDSDINGRIRYQAGEVPDLSIDISSDSVVFAPLLDRPEPQVATAPQFADGRLIPDISVPFAALAGLNGSININIGALQRDQLEVRDLVLRGTLRDGVLEIPVARLDAKSGTIAARVRVAPDAVGGHISLDIVARNFAAGLSDLNQDLAMTGDLDASLSASGDNLRALAASANGAVFVRMHGGRMGKNRFLQAIYGNTLDEILGVLNPFRKGSAYTNLECIILPLEFANGVVTSTPSSLVSTDKIRLVTSSVVKLSNESLDIGVRSTPKRGIVISAGEIVNPYIHILGTLAAPRLAVDEKGVLLSGGAAVATGGLSILARATWDRLSRSKDPCAQATAAGTEALRERLPDLEL